MVSSTSWSSTTGRAGCTNRRRSRESFGATRSSSWTCCSRWLSIRSSSWMLIRFGLRKLHLSSSSWICVSGPHELLWLLASDLQIVRTDLKELRDFDLEGAPYGYTPFCESRREMDGYRFWKSGYWASHLAGRKYHIRHVPAHIPACRPCRSAFTSWSVPPRRVPLQRPVRGGPEEVQEDRRRRQTQRTVPRPQPRPQQPVQPWPGVSVCSASWLQPFRPSHELILWHCFAPEWKELGNVSSESIWNLWTKRSLQFCTCQTNLHFLYFILASVSCQYSVHSHITVPVLLVFSQDLPNNMIHQVPIKSLPQEWLWCETWCDDSSKKKAKTIDLVSVCLCAGPFTVKHTDQTLL